MKHTDKSCVVYKGVDGVGREAKRLTEDEGKKLFVY
jgi:hypothetical protein